MSWLHWLHTFVASFTDYLLPQQSLQPQIPPYPPHPCVCVDRLLRGSVNPDPSGARQRVISVRPLGQHQQQYQHQFNIVRQTKLSLLYRRDLGRQMDNVTVAHRSTARPGGADICRSRTRRQRTRPRLNLRTSSGQRATIMTTKAV